MWSVQIRIQANKGETISHTASNAGVQQEFQSQMFLCFPILRFVSCFYCPAFILLWHTFPERTWCDFLAIGEKKAFFFKEANYPGLRKDNTDEEAQQVCDAIYRLRCKVQLVQAEAEKGVIQDLLQKRPML